jgi:hypothetical protein
VVKVDEQRNGDAAFEMRLLRSANADEAPPGAAREAWSKFASTTSAVALGAASLEPRGILRGVRRGALPWLVAGVVGGSALTAAWMAVRPASSTTASRIGSASMAFPSTIPDRQSLSAPATSPSASSAENILPRDIARPKNASSDHSKRSGMPSRRHTEGRAQAPLSPVTFAAPAVEAEVSTLSAEAAALEGVRAALSDRSFDRALELVGEFHRRFSNGQLTADADALAIEALAARGNRDDAARAASRFLATYPNDPHAARVRSLDALSRAPMAP